VKFIRNVGEKLIESLLTLSGALTSIVVLLIVAFLFREGLGIFQESYLGKTSVLAVHASNSVRKLSPGQVKDLFDGKITNWKTVGGPDLEVKLFYQDDIPDYFTEEQVGKNFEYLPDCINKVMDSLPGVLATFNARYRTSNFSGKLIGIGQVEPSTLLSGREWYPTAEPVMQLGMLPLILGTLWVSLAAILIALPLGLATSIYMAEIANDRIRRLLKPVIELLAGIPSVVYGFFGLVVIVPLIKEIFGLPVGETGLAGSVILAIMALPTIVTISEDAIRNTPRAMKEASLALGATKWQTIWRVVLPYSSSGITAATILGIGRAVGETMAVLMVTGNAAVIPHSLLEPMRTIPATIAAELGEAPQGGMHYKALFALGCILFVFTFIINMSVGFISARRKRANS
jgi:phosphate transport system permease protein